MAVPHPLVTELAKALHTSGVTGLQAPYAQLLQADNTLDADNATKTNAYEAARRAAQTKRAAAYRTYDTKKTAAEQSRAAVDAARNNLATELAKQSTLPELMTFAGYLGGILNDSQGPSKAIWRLLYLDAKLLTWLLMEDGDILLAKRVEDLSSPFGTRDVVWLKSDASVSEGSGPLQPNEIQARFLRGDFTAAGDYAASLRGGTFAPAPGLLTEFRTPGCCGKKTK